MPIALGNILVTGAIYLLISSLGLSNYVFLITLGLVNWGMLFAFIVLVRRVTVASTRHAQAPMLRARRRQLLLAQHLPMAQH
ncbi:MAG TPA: hypothetical protein VHZ51_14095 [Ktedonobacteraceae bacterium]|nr:hypothetical protein [Ktedonobacteraceae bacterium]